MKKKLMIVLGLVMVMACVGLTACGGGEAEEPAAEPAQEEAAVEDETTVDPAEETAAPTEFYGGYGYMGDDPVEGAVYKYMAKKVAKKYYDVEKGMVSVPAICIIDQVENEDGSVDVTGEFEVYNYTVEGDTLVCQSGGSHPGKMHLVQKGDFYKVKDFEPVGDGGDFEPTAKKIFGDKYDEFMEVTSDEDTMNALRAQALSCYVAATGLEVTQYQDYGWDPVEIPQYVEE